MSRYRFLPLSVIDRFVAEARARGVSMVARSGRGFLTAYRRAGGNPRNLPLTWQTKRDAFIARHMAQGRRESLGTGGSLSRRHLALIMWAYSPRGRRVSAGRRRSRGRRL